MITYSIGYTGGGSAIITTLNPLRLTYIEKNTESMYLHDGQEIESIFVDLQRTGNPAKFSIGHAETDLPMRHRVEVVVSRAESDTSRLIWNVSQSVTELRIEPKTDPVELDLLGSRDPKRVKIRITRPILSSPVLPE